MSIRQLKEADLLLSECGRPVAPAGARYVDLPHCLTFRQQVTGGAAGALGLSFPFFPDNVTFQQDFFESGVTGELPPPSSPEITAGAGFNAEGNQVDQPGPWSDGGNRRFMILYDKAGLKIRAYKSTDAGITWAEVNAAGAPAVSNDAVAPNFFEFYGVARDANPAIRRIYCAVWDTDQTVSQVTFDMSTELWGAKVKSTLAYVSTLIEPDSGFTVAYSPSDNSLVVALNVESVLIGGNQYDRSDYAKFHIGSQTWDAAWTRCGTPDSTVDARAWLVQGACVDGVGNVHFQFNVAAGGLAASSLYHQVLHLDNSLSTSDLVITVTHVQLLGDYLCRPLARPVPAGGTEILFGFFEFNNPTHSTFIARGMASDAPTWTIERPLPAMPNTTQYEGFALVNLGQGVVQAVYIQADTGANTASYAAVTNSGPGLGWSAPVVIGTSTWQQTTQSGASSFFSANLLGSSAATSLATVTRIENKSRVGFLCRGVSVINQGGVVPFRLWLKPGRNLEQMISAANFAGFGEGLRTLQPEVMIDPGGKIAIELLNSATAIVYIYFWGVLRFLLDASGDEPEPYLPATARTPRIPGTQNQNIMAPEWMLGNQCCPETPPGYWDEPFTLFSEPIKNAVGKTNVGNSVNVPDDCAVFIVRNVQYNSVHDDGALGTPTVQIRLPEGYSLTDRDYLPADWTGPLFPLLYVERGGRIILDVGDMDSSGAGNITTTVQFDGINRRKV